MPVGSKGHVGLGKETTWGTEETNMEQYLPFISESLNLDIEQIYSEAQKGLIDEPSPYTGLKTLGGDIVIEVHPGSFGHILRSALQEPESAVVEGDAYEHIFKPRQDDFSADCPLCPYTIEVYRDQGDAFQYKGAVVNTLNMSFGVNEKILRATAGILAKDIDSISKTTPSFETTSPFKWDQAVIKIADTQDNNLEAFAFTLDNKLTGKSTLNNTNLISRLYRDGGRSIELALEIDFDDQTQYDIFKEQTQQAFEITLTGAEIETGHNYKMVIDIPKMLYTAYPLNIGGPGLIISSVTGKAVYDSTEEYAMKITLTNKEENY